MAIIGNCYCFFSPTLFVTLSKPRYLISQIRCFVRPLSTLYQRLRTANERYIIVFFWCYEVSGRIIKHQIKHFLFTLRAKKLHQGVFFKPNQVLFVTLLITLDFIIYMKVNNHDNQTRQFFHSDLIILGVLRAYGF